jgi:hypothetical protein
MYLEVNVMKNKPVIFILLAFGFLLNACQFNLPSNGKVKVVQQEKPDLKPVDKTVFLDVGCDWQSDNFAVCADESAFKKMGCDSITSTSDFFSLLNPQVPIVARNYAPFLKDPVDDQAEGVYQQGCRSPLLVRYVVSQDGNYQLVQNISGLQAIFAPIENEQEALAYAIAATGYQANYDFDTTQELRYLVDELPETKVDSVADGFEVLLYDYQFCGCGPHTHFISKVKVFFDGSIQKSDPIPAYEDPEQDGLCVD